MSLITKEHLYLTTQALKKLIPESVATTDYVDTKISDTTSYIDTKISDTMTYINSEIENQIDNAELITVADIREICGIEIITFTIQDGGSYQAEEGMTWLEWYNSTYKPADCLVQIYSDGIVYFGSVQQNHVPAEVYLDQGSYTKDTDVIVANGAYRHKPIIPILPLTT